MTYTILLVLYRKPGLSPQAFKDYYETTHAPLLKSFAGTAMPNNYTRHYIERPDSTSTDVTTSATVLLGSQADFEYDSITQLDFDDVAAFQAYYAATLGSETAKAELVKDEEAFLDRERTRAVVVGESIATPKSSLGA